MTEGHPAFVANNGRIGYGLDDYTAYAPETGSAVRLVWVAARREHTRLSLAMGRSEADHYAAELDDATPRRLRAQAAPTSASTPTTTSTCPLHPWQWANKVAITFAPDLARRDLVLLGEGPDRLPAQQSIRTFYNVSDPERQLHQDRGGDPEHGVPARPLPRLHGRRRRRSTTGSPRSSRPTRRCAAAGSGCSASTRRSATPATRSTGCGRPTACGRRSRRCWPRCGARARCRGIADGERLATMASLLHRDARRRARWWRSWSAPSGQSATSWLRSFLHAYLRPVAHCLLAHDLAFMPHGENVVLVLPRRGAGAGADEGHRRGGGGDERPHLAAAGGGADPDQGHRRREGAGAAHRRVRRVPAPSLRDLRRPTAC